MKRIAATAAALLLSLAALAQSASGDGEVTKVDKAAARLTVKHGGLKALQMPPMTLSFKVADARMLDAVAVGDKVHFSAEKIAGSYTITTLQKAN